MVDAFFVARVVWGFFQSYQFGMEIRLFCMLHYLGACPEAIEYGQLELKDYQAVALVFAPKVFTIWICEAVLEFM